MEGNHQKCCVSSISSALFSPKTALHHVLLQLQSSKLEGQKSMLICLNFYNYCLNCTRVRPMTAVKDNFGCAFFFLLICNNTNWCCYESSPRISWQYNPGQNSLSKSVKTPKMQNHTFYSQSCSECSPC